MENNSDENVNGVVNGMDLDETPEPVNNEVKRVNGSNGIDLETPQQQPLLPVPAASPNHEENNAPPEDVEIADAEVEILDVVSAPIMTRESPTPSTSAGISSETTRNNLPLSPSFNLNHIDISSDSDDSDGDDMSQDWPNILSDENILEALGVLPDTQDTDSDDEDIVTIATPMSLDGNSQDPIQIDGLTPPLANSNNTELSSSTQLPPEKPAETETEKKSRPAYLEKCFREDCFENAMFVCTECRKVGYCSESHQLEDWERHRNACLHYALSRPPNVQYWGPLRIDKYLSVVDEFHIVSTQEIHAGTKILEEKPFLISPWPRLRLRFNEYQSLRGLIVRCLTCFGCCKYIGWNFVGCKNCNLPICSTGCEQIENHQKNECNFIKEMLDGGKLNTDSYYLLRKFAELETDTTPNKYMELFYTDVMILRLVCKLSEIGKQEGLAKQEEIWAKLCSQWKIHEKKRTIKSKTGKLIFSDIQKHLPISFFALKGNTDYVWKLYCIVKSNSFQFDLPYRRFNVLCTVLNQARHSCKPNSHAFLNQPEGFYESDLDELTIVLRSGVNINPGESITFSYCPLILGTLQRRPRLMNSHLFWCKCHRCLDPTECGTYMSSIKCPTCNIGHLSPPLEYLCRKPTAGEENRETDYGRTWTCNLNRSGRCNRLGGTMKANTAIKQFIDLEKDGLKYVGNVKYTMGFVSLYSKPTMPGRHTHLKCYPESHQAFLKIYDDILRGALYQLSDVSMKSIEDFDGRTLNAVIEAKKKYRATMKLINPGFNFEGFPGLAINFMMNEAHIPKGNTDDGEGGSSESRLEHALSLHRPDIAEAILISEMRRRSNNPNIGQLRPSVQVVDINERRGQPPLQAIRRGRGAGGGTVRGNGRVVFNV